MSKPIFTALRAGLWLLLSVAISAPAAAAGKGQLDAFLSGLESMRADFIQSLLDSEDSVLEESEGVIYVQRPGRFRLEYQTPYEQLYVADGDNVWMYDKDLVQVTVRPQGDALSSTPALLLSSTEPLENNFRINELGEHAGFVWLELRPRGEDANFEYIRLALESGSLRAMEMVDSFGQTTRIYFKNLERNPTLDAGKFSFDPPPGVDVVGKPQ